MRLRLHDHVILVQLRVHGVDLALAEGVVQCVVDGCRRDAQSRRRHPVDRQRHRQPSGLLIGSHVFQLGQLLQFGDESIGP